MLNWLMMCMLGAALQIGISCLIAGLISATLH